MMTEKAEARGTGNAGLLAQISQDIGYALRSLRKAPGFAAVAVATLALGIGANTAIFSVVNGILLRPLPFQDPDRLVMVAASYDGRRAAPASPANIVDWQTQNHSFTSIAIVGGQSAVLTGSGDPERLRGSEVSADFFTVLGVKPVVGRLAFTPDEAAFNGSKAVLLNESLWKTRFGGDLALVGKTITLDNESYLVAGIVPAAAAWPANAVFWMPFTFDPAHLAQSRGAVYLNAIARLKPGVTLESAAADMKAVQQRLDTEYPEANTGVGSKVLTMQEGITGDLRRPLYVLLGGVAFVLLIACANVANLLLVRGVAREGEIAVRTALGAGRGRLMRQLVTESVVLSLIGGAAGLMLAVYGTQLLVSLAPASIPRLDSIRVDGVVLGFTLLVAVATGVVFGLVPSRQLTRPDVAKTLREGGRSGGRAGTHRARSALVIAEVALSVMLLVGAGLLIHSFQRLTTVDPGFRTENSIAFTLSLPQTKYDTPEKTEMMLSQIMERVHAIPGVAQSGAAFGLPLTNFRFGFSFSIAGRPPAKQGEEPDAEVRMATPDYFPTMGIRVLKGRGLTAEDRAGAPGALLITETGRQRFFPNEDPIGKHIKIGIGRNGHNLEGDIVGVVADTKQSSLATATLPQFWIPYAQWPMNSVTVVMHTTRDPFAAVADARRGIKELDPDLALSSIKTLDQVVSESVAQPRFYMVLLAVFAGVAVLLSAIGIYGVIAYLVGQRSREIGIRLALGASQATVIRMIARDGAIMTAAGIGVGLLGAFALTRSMTALLFDVKPSDPVTYLAVTALLAAVALAASCIPALRAAHVDPALTMRAE
jgi:putative ABC transport system permease protein